MVDPILFQIAAEQTKDYAVFLLDPAGHILTWNAGAERIKGYTADEIIGQHFSIFYTRQSLDSGWPAHELNVAAAEGRFDHEGWRVRKDGSRFWASVVITALRDRTGRLLGFSKITRDLTQRKLQEEALAQSEEKFRLLVGGVVDYAIFMLDREGIVTSWNAGAERIKGYKPEEVIGKHFSRFFIPEDVAAGKPWEELDSARSTGRSESEGWRVRKDGQRFWARAVLSALHDSDGNLRGFAKVTQDLTARRHAQELEAAAKNVEEFIAILAHELRNPLAPIETAMQVIAHTPPAAPEREDMLKIIGRQTAQLRRVVDDMLDISRVTRGELRIERSRIDLAEVARVAAETAAPAIGAAKHRLEMNLAPTPLYVEGDYHRLTQVLANLLNNAARYSPEGGSIRVSTRAEGGYAVLTVTDTGRGIAPQWINRIFNMFVHKDSAIERVGGGLGVGLALSRRIAELHGGSLTASSGGEHKGSEFTLRIPLSAQNVEATKAEATLSSPAVATRAREQRVLIVDDNIDAAVSLQLLLGSLGHATAVAHNGEDALTLSRKFKPDVVLLDIGLPDIDGYEVARRLRSIKGNEHLRIVAVTGWGGDAKQKALEAGFDLHLVKPVDSMMLEQALTQRNGTTLH
jgi:PAS domain S-box-containing protein